MNALTKQEYKITHGRHCTCSACAREDWARITGPCGMHGKDCPATYAPLGPAGARLCMMCGKPTTFSVCDACCR
jgi:hypothetical protein